jgi:hypothetical protein
MDTKISEALPGFDMLVELPSQGQPEKKLKWHDRVSRLGSFLYFLHLYFILFFN